jgi:hypothetical protein
VSRIFRWVGVRGAILVLPLVMVVNYGLILVMPVFALVRLMMIVENATNYSVQGTTNHTLYLPVGREEKYVGKTTIDTFFARFGDLLQAMLIYFAAELLGLELGWIIAVNLCLAGVLFGLGTAIGRYHRSEIRDKLENLPPVVNARLPTSTCRPARCWCSACRTTPSWTRIPGTRCATQPAGPMAERSRPGSASTATTRPSPCNRRRTRPAASPWR